jgi:hypothetical protein
VAFDDLYATGRLDPIPSSAQARAADADTHPAVFTWDVSEDGPVPVARRHSELIAGGLAVLLECRFARDPALLAALTMSSFAGLAVAIVPWLLAAGTLVLHQPFDADTFRAQSRGCDAAIVPGPLAGRLAAEVGFAAHGGVANVIGVWRAPKLVSHALPWCDGKTRLIDVHAFGEVGLIAACRGQDGKPAAIAFGGVVAPRGPNGTMTVAELAPTPRGTVALRGPMVPMVSPADAERGSPGLKAAPGGFVAGARLRRQLPLRAARVAGAGGVPRERGRVAGGAARCARRPSFGRECLQTRLYPAITHNARRQSAAGECVPRAPTCCQSESSIDK